MIKHAMLTAALLAFGAAPALAVTVTNRDSKEHTVTFDKGAEEVDMKVAAGASVTHECPEGCGVRVRDLVGYDYMAAKGEKLAIVTGQTRVMPDKK
jgi:hypothetical protein